MKKNLSKKRKTKAGKSVFVKQPKLVHQNETEVENIANEKYKIVLVYKEM